MFSRKITKMIFFSFLFTVLILYSASRNVQFSYFHVLTFIKFWFLFWSVSLLFCFVIFILISFSSTLFVRFSSLLIRFFILISFSSTLFVLFYSILIRFFHSDQFLFNSICSFLFYSDSFFSFSLVSLPLCLFVSLLFLFVSFPFWLVSLTIWFVYHPF